MTGKKRRNRKEIVVGSEALPTAIEEKEPPRA